MITPVLSSPHKAELAAGLRAASLAALALSLTLVSAAFLRRLWVHLIGASTLGKVL